MDNTIQKPLFKSLEREKELQRQLNESKNIIDQLRLQLEIERKKTITKGLTAFSKLKSFRKKAQKKLNDFLFL